MKQTWMVASIAVVLGSLPPAATPAEQLPPGTWRVRESLGAAVNPAALQNEVEASKRRGRVAVGVGHVASPAYTRVHGWVEITPVRAASLRLGAMPSVYFGTFHSLLGFESAQDDYSDEARRARAPAAEAGTALCLYAAPTVRVAAGPLLAVASASLERWSASTGESFFYEPSRDALLDASGGRMLTTTSSTLALRRPRGDGGELLAGVVHRLTHLSGASGNDAQRVGVVATRSFGAGRFGGREPRLSATVLYALQDRFRKGQVAVAASVGFRVGH